MSHTPQGDEERGVFVCPLRRYRAHVHTTCRYIYTIVHVCVLCICSYNMYLVYNIRLSCLYMHSVYDYVYILYIYVCL